MAADNKPARPAVWERIRETVAGVLGVTVVSEMIGRAAIPAARMSLYRARSRPRSIDHTIADYEFYDRLRRGKADGYRLGGLFAKRIEVIIAAWVLGDGLTVELYNEGAEAIPEDRRIYTNELLKQFVAELLDAGAAAAEEGADPDREDEAGGRLQSSYKDALGLGDAYIIVNADGSLSIPSPETVEVIRDALDYRHIEAVRVTTKLEKYTIVDEYRAFDRTITISRAGRVVEVFTYQNLIGRIPVIHIANARSSNETNGHPIHESLLELYDRYDDILYKQLDGAALLGNPILTFAGMEDITAVTNANAPAVNDTYTDKDGYETTRPQLNVDRNAVIFIGKGGSAQYIAPPVGFTADTKTALKSLFLLLLDHTGIPESVWGAELGSARATADTQQDQFVREVLSWRQDSGGWIMRLVRIWLQIKALTDPRIYVGRLMLEWPPIVQDGKELRLKQIEFAKGESLVTDQTALELLELVKDPAAETAAAAAETAERRRDAFPVGDDFDFDQALRDAQAGATDDDIDDTEEQ